MELYHLVGDNVGLFITLITILGLTVGSFLNVVIHRLPKMMQNRWHHECCELLQHPNHPSDAVYNLLKPDSHCPQCQTPIRFRDNIPLVSYLWLQGKCAHCSARISPRYPLVELTTAILSGFLAYKLGNTPLTFVFLLMTWALIALTMIDIDHQLLPDSITLPLLWLGLLVNSSSFAYVDLHSAVIGAAAGYMVLWCVFWAFKILTGKEGMGYGDFKLLAALGAWMGWQQLPVIIILSSFVGALIGIMGILLRGKDKNIPIPFGPYLAIAGWIALLWGSEITDSYLKFAGLHH